MPDTTLDHLVIAAATLEQGVEYIRDLLGVEPAGGGTHAAQGTHNRLLRLGDDRYLEVIAIDPDGAEPQSPRWFELDSPAMQAALAVRPRLVTWVARTTDIESLAARSAIGLGRIRPMSRGALRWRITLTDDGSLPAGGLVPPLIQWDTAPHPATSLPDAACEPAPLEGLHPDPDGVNRTLGSLGLAGWLSPMPAQAGTAPRLRAHIQTPSGLRILDIP